MMELTSWGYSVDGEITDFITTEEYDAYTGGKYTGDARIETSIKSASAAIRNYCGWHVYPELPCKLSTTFFDRRVSMGRGGILIQLPARFVSEVTSITINGEECATYVLEPNGLLKIYCTGYHEEYTPIVVEYTAGLPDDMMDVAKEMAANGVTHVLASSYGVTSEAAGGVSITYNASWTKDTRATILTDESKEILSPYRIGGVF